MDPVKSISTWALMREAYSRQASWLIPWTILCVLVTILIVILLRQCEVSPESPTPVYLHDTWPPDQEPTQQVAPLTLDGAPQP
jgi:hypothetical protein